MDFFTEAVDVLAAIVRALSRPDSPEDYFEGCWEMRLVKSRKTVLPLVKNHTLMAANPGGAGKR